MSFQTYAPSALQGEQRPSVCHVPPHQSSAGQEAVELAKYAGLILDPWQEFVLSGALGERKNGKWAAFEVGLVVPRQNGKGAILEARELAGLFLLGERLIIHSAHQFDTSLEAFRRVLALIEDTPDFSKRVKRVSRSHGEEGIELTNGQRIRFRTRTKGGGRGFTGDCLVLDEAMYLPESAHGALLPTLSARPNSQVWYTGSAVDQWVHDNGVVLSRLRERGHKGDDPGLAYFEWAHEAAHPEWIEPDVATTEEAWAKANPGLGIRISSGHIANEQRAMDPRTFAVERLGVGDWPNANAEKDQVIGAERWNACADPHSTFTGVPTFAFDVTPNRSQATIAVAGLRSDGHLHIEVVERGKGTGWVIERLKELLARHKAHSVVCDTAGPAASLLPQLEEHEVEVSTVTAKEYARACGHFFDAAEQENLRHLNTSDLNASVRGAATRPLGEAWAWSRKTSSIDISPLVACTLAAWGASTMKPIDGASWYAANKIEVL